MQLDLASVLTPADTLTNVLSATVAAVYADGTVDVDLGGNRIISGAPVLGSYTPVIGDIVEVIRRDLGSWLVLGSIRQSNATTVSVSNSWSVPYDVLPKAGGSTANPFVVTAASTKSWRNIDGWSRSDVYQGAYSASLGSSTGYWRGCYFYGSSAFSALAGQTCTRLQIHLSRESTGGIGGACRQYIAPHVHGSQPSGSPIFTTGAVIAGSLAWGASGWFDLPVEWGQALINGTVKGFGHLYLGSAYYSIDNPKSSDSSSGEISLSWK